MGKRRQKEQTDPPHTKKGKEPLEKDEKSLDEGSEVSDVDVDIDFFDPAPRHRDSLIPFVRKYVDSHKLVKCKQFEPYELVKLIVEQPRVGTVIEMDETVFGFITVLNFQKYHAVSCIELLEKYLLSNCPDPEKLKQILTTKKQLGLIISERMVNLPPQVASPLQEALFNEVSWATEDEPTPELRASFKFDNYMVVTTAFSPADDEEETKRELPDASTLIYTKPEDSLYLQASNYHFVFREAPHPEYSDFKQSFDGNMSQYRVCMVFSAKQAQKIMEALK